MTDDRAQPNYFGGDHIDRRAEERTSTDWHLAALDDREALFLIARDTAHLMQSSVEPSIAFLSNTHPLVLSADPRRLVLLGWFRGVRCVLLEVDAKATSLVPAATKFEELRPLASHLPAPDASLLAYARALSFWRARTRFCAACGSPTEPRSAGHVMRCSSETCAQEFFPRLDPAIIVLVSDGERALLGRQASWPPRRYSTLAGFVEPAESLEDAVRREVMEETGVEVFGVRYHSSQPWPFPSSLMVGFEARAEPESIVRLSGELEDARWFTPEQILTEAILPPAHSISYRLISAWLASRKAQ